MMLKMTTQEGVTDFAEGFESERVKFFGGGVKSTGASPLISKF
jgi:hypothetical protein